MCFAAKFMAAHHDADPDPILSLARAKHPSRCTTTSDVPSNTTYNAGHAITRAPAIASTTIQVDEWVSLSAAPPLPSTDWRAFCCSTSCCCPHGVADGEAAHQVLAHQPEILRLILQCLKPQVGQLAELVHVSKLFYQTGIDFIWERALLQNLGEHVESFDRRRQLASFITDVHLQPSESLGFDAGHLYDAFTRLETLTFFHSNVANSTYSALLSSMFQSSLRSLKVDIDIDEENRPHQTMHDEADADWLALAETNCPRLTHLEFQALKVAPDQLTGFLESMKCLKTVILGSEVDDLITAGAIISLLKKPALNHLSLAVRLSEAMARTVATVLQTSSIKPVLHSLDITVSQNVGAGLIEIFQLMQSLEELRLTIKGVRLHDQHDLDWLFFPAIAQLKSLRRLRISIDPTVELSGTDLQTLTTLPFLDDLTITPLLSNPLDSLVVPFFSSSDNMAKFLLGTSELRSLSINLNVRLSSVRYEDMVIMHAVCSSMLECHFYETVYDDAQEGMPRHYPWWHYEQAQKLWADDTDSDEGDQEDETVP